MRTSMAPVADAADAQDLQPIRLYLAEMVLVASVSPGEERMTDILNHGGELRVLPAGAQAWDPDNWVNVQIDEAQLIVPPRHVSPSHKRQQRYRHPVRLRVGDWDVQGTAHLKPGAEQDAVLLSVQPFLPLTDVTMASTEHPWPETYEVVIVNLRHAEFVVD
ncbi:MAG TPA: hypothetical protein VJ839_00525 [Candidatus Limnocylindria bacterium]|nr:hypothetical protein [Candidatus Limnocylindria bacterium]